jgi:hypothetical protein
MRRKEIVTAEHDMKAYAAVEVQLDSIYTSAPPGGEWSASS